MNDKTTARRRETEELVAQLARLQVEIEERRKSLLLTQLASVRKTLEDITTELETDEYKEFLNQDGVDAAIFQVVGLSSILFAMTSTTPQ